MKEILQTLSLFLCMLASQSCVALDFLQALNLAKISDPEILAAEFEYRAMLETRPQSQSALLPTVKLSVFSSQSKLQTTNSPNPSVIVNGSIVNVSSRYRTNGYSLSLLQSIYSYGLYKQLEKTDINIALSTAKINEQRQKLILRVAEAYFLVLAAEDNLRFAQAEEQAIAQQLTQTKNRLEVGLIAITDVIESQARYDVSVAQQISAENKRAINIESLRSIIGEKPALLKPLTADIELIIPQPANMQKWVDDGKHNNLSLQVAKLSYDMARKQIDIDKSDHYPYLDLSARHNYISTEGLSTDSKATSMSLTLTIPIYSGGLTSAKTRQAILLAEQARALRNKAYRQAVEAIRKNYLGVTTSIAQVKAFKQSLISTQAAHEATQAGFEVGTRTSVDVLASLREQYRAEKNYAKARYTYVLNILKLKSAAGILSKQDVVQVNQWLMH